jgi:catechol 2,3-dioxygenase-like lactoylglutathione lyase family enzyme
MPIGAVSHIAIGVHDMERSLRFYRDLLGLRPDIDREIELKTPEGPRRRREVYLRWSDGPRGTFVVLDQQLPVAEGEPLALFRVGVHHIGFLVDDLESTYARLVAAGVPVVVPLTRTADSKAYGEVSGDSFMTAFFRDPDGTVVQLDQRVTAG